MARSLWMRASRPALPRSECRGPSALLLDETARPDRGKWNPSIPAGSWHRIFWSRVNPGAALDFHPATTAAGIHNRSLSTNHRGSPSFGLMLLPWPKSTGGPREDKQSTMRARWIQPQTLTENNLAALSLQVRSGMVEVYKGTPILMPCRSMMFISGP
jgi:hypothetical protein